MKSLFTFKFSRLFVEYRMPKFTRKFSSRQQLHVQQQKKQINKERDVNSRTEKHLPRQRINFIWDSKREKFKWKYIWGLFEHEALRHMIGLMFSIGGKHSTAKHWNEFSLLVVKISLNFNQKWKKSDKVLIKPHCPSRRWSICQNNFALKSAINGGKMTEHFPTLSIGKKSNNKILFAFNCSAILSKLCTRSSFN